MKKNIWLCIVLGSIASFVPATAQDVTAAFVGAIQDASGSPVPGAKITITNTDKNAVIRVVTASADGNFSAPLLPIGHYELKVEAKGFKTAVKRSIELNVNDQLTEDIKLEVGDVQQQVTVESDPVQVELQSPASGTVITGAQVTELSLNARNYEQLVSLMPGVTYTGVGDQIYVGVSNPLSGASNAVSFSINGARTSQNAWTVDGADNVDRGANLTLLNYPSVDAIQEFRVLRGQYSAEFGRNAGGMVNVVTKSGTNQIHGDAYEFFRNDKLAANTYFNNLGSVNPGPDGKARVPPLRYNNFGYTAGGPVYIPKFYNGRNKTFFFFSQEYRRVITYQSVQGVGPTAAEKAGTFSSPVCVAQTSAGVCTQTSSQITNIDPLAAAYIKDVFSKIPDAPASHTLNLALRNVFNYRQELIKIDHVFSERWAVSGRYIQDAIPTEEPRGLFTAAALPGVSNTSTNSPGKGVIFRFTGSITPTLLNEAGYSYSYGAILSTPTGLDATVNSPDVNAKLPFPVTLGRIPSLSFSGALSTLTGFGPYLDYNRNHNWFDNVTKIAGKHTVKAGGSIIRYNKQENQATNNVGTFTFGTGARPTGTSTAQQAWANFLLGNVATFTQTGRDLTPSIRVNQAELYVQDDYRVRRNLTVNAGVRYSIFRQPFDANGFLNNFDPSRYDPAKAPKIDSNGNLVPGTGDPLNGLIVNGKNSPYGNKVSNERNKDFAPRVGFSWDPFGDGKTAIRSGYGIAYDFPQVGIYESPILNNPSSVQTITINNTTLQNPAGGTLGVSVAPPGISGLALPYKTPYVQQWSFDIQRELPGKLILDIGYYGSKGTHLIGEPDINEPLPGAGAAAGLTPPGVAFNRTTDPKLNAVRPYLGYSSINAIETWFNSNYNGLQVSVRKTLGKRGFVNGNYTWSKTLTNAGTDVAAPSNTYNRKADYGLSPYDRKQVISANWSWALPYLTNQKAFIRHSVGGWQYSGIVSVATGLPFNASDSTLGTDPGGLGFLGSSQAGPRADQICDPNANAPHTFTQWFNTACFSDVPAGQIRPGNAGRNTIRGPGFQKWDMSLFKNFKFNEHFRMQFRAESFNTFNHTNWASIGSTLGASTFGLVTAARDPRVVQLALKLYY